jgi:hypothetical protein
MSYPPISRPVADFLLPLGKLVDGARDLAHVPGRGLALEHGAVLVEHGEHEAARAQRAAHELARGGVGVDDHDHVADRQRLDPRLDQVHLLLEPRVGGRVGEDHDGPGDPAEVLERYLGRVEDPGAVGLPCSTAVWPFSASTAGPGAHGAEKQGEGQGRV